MGAWDRWECKAVGLARERSWEIPVSLWASVRGMVGCVSRALLILWSIQERLSWAHIPWRQNHLRKEYSPQAIRDECKSEIWMSLRYQIEVSGAKTQSGE